MGRIFDVPIIKIRLWCAIIVISMSVVLGILIGLFMLMFLVTAHEFGHFIMARRNGVEVEEFGICFPPRAIAWRKVNGKWRRLKKSEWEKVPGEGTIVSLNWLPIGGFCQMKGESASDTAKGSFGKANFWRKTKILFGGVLANWLVAAIILTVLAWSGMPHFIDNQFQIDADTKAIGLSNVVINEVMDDSPAKVGGLAEGDEIISIITPENKHISINTVDELLDFDQRHAGETVYMNIIRDGESMMAEIRLNPEGSDYILGATISGDAVYVSTWSAPIVGVGVTAQLTGETFKGVGQLLYNLVSGVVKQVNPNAEVRSSGAEELKEAGDSVSGPVGIVGVLFPRVAQSGGRNLLYLVALISISLACMNVLPIPALDGGRWLLIAIFKVRKKKLTKEKEEKIVSRAFMVILAIALIVTILDITRIIG